MVTNPDPIGDPSYEPKYLLICQSCSFKYYTVASSPLPLIEVKTALPPLHADGKNKELQKMPRKFKCPECGNLMRVCLAPAPPPEEVKNSKEDKYGKEQQKEMQWP